MEAPERVQGTIQTFLDGSWPAAAQQKERSEPNKAQPDVVVCLQESTNKSSGDKRVRYDYSRLTPQCLRILMHLDH